MFLNNMTFNANAICTSSLLWFPLPHQMKQESKSI